MRWRRHPAGKPECQTHAVTHGAISGATTSVRLARSVRGSRLRKNRKRRSRRMARKRGRGMAACWYGIARTAVIDRAAAWADIDGGGSAKIVTGVTGIGEGILTVLAQIAAHEMGVKPEHVVIGDNDTGRAPEASHAGASRQTYMIGNAGAPARRGARKRLVDVMAEVWDVDAEAIRTGNGEIWAENTNHRITMGEAVSTAKNRGVVPVGSATFGTDTTGLPPVDGSGRPSPAYVFRAQGAGGGGGT